MGIVAPNPERAKGYAAERYDMIATGPEKTMLITDVSRILEAAR